MDYEDKAYIIKDVAVKDRWTSRFDRDMITYSVKLDGIESTVQINKFATSPAPQPEDEIYGRLLTSVYGLKFKDMTNTLKEA